MSPDAPINGSKIRQVMVGYVCAGVHNGTGFRPRGVHKSAKRVGADLLMGGSHGKCIAGGKGHAFARVGFPVYGRVGYQRILVIGYGGGMIRSPFASYIRKTNISLIRRYSLYSRPL